MNYSYSIWSVKSMITKKRIQLMYKLCDISSSILFKLGDIFKKLSNMCNSLTLKIANTGMKYWRELDED